MARKKFVLRGVFSLCWWLVTGTSPVPTAGGLGALQAQAAPRGRCHGNSAAGQALPRTTSPIGPCGPCPTQRACAFLSSRDWQGRREPIGSGVVGRTVLSGRVEGNGGAGPPLAAGCWRQVMAAAVCPGRAEGGRGVVLPPNPGEWGASGPWAGGGTRQGQPLPHG